jgi:hypothetical protein
MGEGLVLVAVKRMKAPRLRSELRDFTMELGRKQLQLLCTDGGL